MKTNDRTSRIASDDIERVEAILEELDSKSILLVTHSEAFENSGASAKLKRVLSSRGVLSFTQFEPNPKLPDAESAIELLHSHPCDTVLAIGGGSAIDMAKLICLFSAQSTPPRETIANASKLKPRTLSFVAIPTTAGTGSEATHFAVVYVDGKKHSLAHPSLIPDFVILDPDLTANLPPYLTTDARDLIRKFLKRQVSQRLGNGPLDGSRKPSGSELLEFRVRRGTCQLFLDLEAELNYFLS